MMEQHHHPLPHHPIWSLPPPSQLHLQNKSFAAENTLPPIHQEVHHWEPSPINIKTEPMQHSKESTPPSAFPSTDDPMPSTSDFVKKLYKFVSEASHLSRCS